MSGSFGWFKIPDALTRVLADSVRSAPSGARTVTRQTDASLS